MLKGFCVVMASLLGEQHALSNNLKQFLEDLEGKESIYADRLE
jgi:hypothetical protein